MARRFLTLLVLCLLASGGHVAGRRPADPPAAVVLKGATVVVGDGQVLPGATIVVRDGLIAAVGTTVAVPAGAREIDLTGSFVYPGLIDALTEQGLQKPSVPGKEEEPTDTESAALFAHVRAADMLDPTAKDWASWRDAGVLAVNVRPGRGIFMGQTAVVSLNGEASGRMVVKPSVAMYTALQGLGYRNRRKGQGEPGGVYPTRLIGVQSFIRQTLLDAHDYDDAMKVAATHPRGVERPATSRSLDALLPVVRRTMPLIFPASEQRFVQRVIDIADETNVRCIVAGGEEASLLASALKQRSIPVLVSLNFPGDEKDVHPEFEVAVSVLRFREHAPKAAAELSRAGVRFAFYSDGLGTGRDFLGNLRLAVKAGLPKDAAIRAATLTAAEILGVDQQLGSIEAGKAANLVVASGDLLDDQSQVRTVFVDGRRFDIAAGGGKRATKDSAPTPARAIPALDPPPDPSLAIPRAGEILIKNATVMTVTKGTITNASVLIRDGKIAAVGRTVDAGPRAQVIDATGKFVTPGMIDCHAHAPTDSHNEATISVTSMTNIKDNLNPTDIQLYRVLAGGVTTINIFHGSVNPIGGKNAVIKMRWGKTAPELLFQGARPSLKMALKDFGVSGRVRSGSDNPSSLMGVEAVIRTTLRQAQRYRHTWENYEKQKAAGVSPLIPPRRDLAMEPLVEVLKGERAVHVHTEHEARGMLMILRVAREFGFGIKTFQHASNAFMIADEMKREGVSASLFGSFAAETMYNAAVLIRKGIWVSVNSDGAARDLNKDAAGLMKYGGLTDDEALAMVTINPARQLDIDKRVGSIEVGKDADLVIWRHHPLSTYAITDTVFIDGLSYFTQERDKARQTWLEAERKRLGSGVVKAAETQPASGKARGFVTEVSHVR